MIVHKLGLETIMLALCLSKITVPAAISQIVIQINSSWCIRYCEMYSGYQYILLLIY